MNRSTFYIKIKLFLAIAVISVGFYSCEGDLNQEVYDQLSTGTFFKTADDAKAAVTASYRGIPSIWNPSNYETVAQASMSTDELICSWGWDGWKRLNNIDFSEDFSADVLSSPYFGLIPTISEVTINISKIQPIDMDENLKARYIAELTALRAIYGHQLLNLYGPLTIITDPVRAADPAAEFVPRPSVAEMVTIIENDYKEAAAVLPDRFTGDDYGRISGTACLAGLMHLYIHEKRWGDAITIGRQILEKGYSLMPDYDDNFTLANKGGNDEIILALPTRPDANSNYWLAMALTSAYVDPSGQVIMAWGGYKMPWTTYDKFDQTDKRLKRLLAIFPTTGGEMFDARANGYIGALPMKYGPDPAALDASHGVDYPIYRYADILLLLAEAINETDGPTDEAYSFINRVRDRAGLADLTPGLDEDQFRSKIMDERLFELWCEGFRRNDMIRWGTYIQRAIDAGSIWAKPEFVLYPLPRSVITESGGIVKQNDGY
jgi:starch-binding outer membrane protein, SusD/RagB family